MNKRLISKHVLALALAFGVSSVAHAQVTYTYSFSSSFADWANIVGWTDGGGYPSADTSGGTGSDDNGTVTGTFTLDSSYNWVGGSFMTGASASADGGESGSMTGATYSNYTSASIINSSGNFDMFGAGGNDVFFSDNSGNFTLDLALPDLSGLATVGDSWAGTGVVSEFQSNIDGSLASYPNVLDGYSRYDYNGQASNMFGLPASVTDQNTGGTSPTFNEVGPTHISLQSINVPQQTSTPEPVSLALLGSGLLGLGAVGRRFSRRR